MTSPSSAGQRRRCGTQTRPVIASTTCISTRFSLSPRRSSTGSGGQWCRNGLPQSGQKEHCPWFGAGRDKRGRHRHWRAALLTREPTRVRRRLARRVRSRALPGRRPSAPRPRLPALGGASCNRDGRALSVLTILAPRSRRSNERIGFRPVEVVQNGPEGVRASVFGFN